MNFQSIPYLTNMNFLNAKTRQGTKKRVPLPKPKYTELQVKELEQLFIEYGKNVRDIINDKCMNDKTKQLEYWDSMCKKAESSNNVNFLKNVNSSVFTKNTTITCSKTKQDYFIFCFPLESGNSNGISSVSYTASRVSRAVKDCWVRSLKRKAKRGDSYTSQFELCLMSILKVFKEQQWKCSHCFGDLHASSNVSGYWSIDRINDNRDYSLDNVRIIHSKYQAGHGFSVTEKYIKCLEDPTQGLYYELDMRVIDRVRAMQVSSIAKDVSIFRCCLVCSKWKVRETEYSKNYTCNKGHDSRCKNCVYERRKFLKANKNALKRKRTTTLTPARLVQNVLSKCRHTDEEKFSTNDQSIVFNDIVNMFIEQGGRCVNTNLPLEFNETNSKDKNATAFNLSVDRIDPNRPHVRDNCQLVVSINNVQSNGRKV